MSVRTASARDPARSRAIGRKVVVHFRKHSRSFAFRETRDPYAIWVCEVMAQQTRIAKVLPYWQRWLARFPTPRALADAGPDDVLSLWSGLGYYARARSLHRAAHEVVAKYNGRVPDDLDALLSLPGVGPYTAGAIASIAFGRPTPAVDGNVARVLARVFAISDDLRAPATTRLLWQLAADALPKRAPGEFNQGLMDIGATICTPNTPSCPACPLAHDCRAHQDGREHELPVRHKRAATPRVDIDVVWIERGGRCLLVRRRPDGLFGGLWELPSTDLFAEGKALVRVRRRALAAHTQQLSHRTLHYRVFAGTMTGRALAVRPTDTPHDAARFFARDELASVGMSAAMTALLARLPRPAPPPARRKIHAHQSSLR